MLLLSVYVVYKSFSSDKTYTDSKATIKLCNVVSEKYVEVIKPKKQEKDKVVPEVTNKKTEKLKKHKIKTKKIVKQKSVKKHKIEKTQTKEFVKTKSIDNNVSDEKVEITAAKKEVDCKVQKQNIQISKQEKEIKQKFIDDNMFIIAHLLQENLYYPRRARKRGITGVVLVKFSIDINGEVDSVKVEKSSNDILSRAAIKTIENLSGEFPKPKEKLVLSVPINYELK